MFDYRLNEVLIGWRFLYLINKRVSNVLLKTRGSSSCYNMNAETWIIHVFICAAEEQEEDSRNPSLCVCVCVSYQFHPAYAKSENIILLRRQQRTHPRIKNGQIQTREKIVCLPAFDLRNERSCDVRDRVRQRDDKRLVCWWMKLWCRPV